MPDPLLVLAILVLAGALAAAVARPRWLPEAVAAAAGAAILVAAGAISPDGAWDAVDALVPPWRS